MQTLKSESVVWVIATFRQRLAAFLLDLLLIATLASVSLEIVVLFKKPYITSLLEQSAGKITPSFFFVPVIAGLLYACVLEWVFGATPGKVLCALKVKSLGRTKCELTGALVRNVLRPLDVLVGPVMLLTSPGRQRLGDRVGSTTVIVKLENHPSRDAQQLKFATWEERLKAAIIDGVLISCAGAVYLYSFGLLQRIKSPWSISTLLPIVVLTELLFWYLVISEAKYGAPIGKLATGLRIVTLKADPPFVVAALRTLFYPLNVLSLGLPSLLLIHQSRRRQSLADFAAATAIVGQPFSHSPETEDVPSPDLNMPVRSGCLSGETKS